MSDVSATLAADSPKTRFRPLKLPALLQTRRRITYLALTAAILSIYSYPALRTAHATGSRRLPSVSAEDLGLYLSLSRIEKDADGTRIEPYYGLRVPANAAGFFKFRDWSRSSSEYLRIVLAAEGGLRYSCGTCFGGDFCA